MVSWADPHLQPSMPEALALAAHAALMEGSPRRHLITCTFCGLPALTWTPIFAACDDCLDRQEALD